MGTGNDDGTDEGVSDVFMMSKPSESIVQVQKIGAKLVESESESKDSTVVTGFNKRYGSPGEDNSEVKVVEKLSSRFEVGSMVQQPHTMEETSDNIGLNTNDEEQRSLELTKLNESA